MSRTGYIRDQAARNAAPTEVPRDRWKRPLIIPVDGGDPIAHTRVSTLAKALDDQTQLMMWKQRKTAEGMVRRPDLLTRIAGSIANGDPDTDWRAKRELNAVCSEAIEAAGASKGSSAGTGLHSLTEAIDRGKEPLYVPEADRVRLNAYREATRGYTALLSEQFVVCDELQVAGSFDRLWMTPDSRVVVGDLKTGKSEKTYPLATATQIAMYANSLRYDPATGERQPIHEHLDKTTGLLIHMPATGGCEVIELDLVKGWEAAKVAARVHHEIRRWRPADLIRGGAA